MRIISMTHRLTTRLKRGMGQRGDTLLEVTLAIAVLGVLLGGTYAIARRGLRIGEASQERIEALKVLEGQAERLRAYRDSTAWNLNTLSASPFCFLVNQQTPYSLPTAGSTCGLGPNGRYSVVITYQSTSTPPVFVLRATWQGIGGTGDQQNGENVEYRYRLW